MRVLWYTKWKKLNTMTYLHFSKILFMEHNAQNSHMNRCEHHSICLKSLILQQGCSLTLSVPCTARFCWTLHNHNLPADYWVRELFKPSKDTGSLVVHIFSKIGKVMVLFFCGWHHNGGRFTHFGRGHRALGFKAMTQFFDSKFYWKQGYNSSH